MSHLTRARILAWISSLLLTATVAASAWVYLVEADSYGPEFASSGFQIKGLPAGVETSYVVEQVEQAAAAESVNIYKPEHTVSKIRFPSTITSLRVTPVQLEAMLRMAASPLSALFIRKNC